MSLRLSVHYYIKFPPSGRVRVGLKRKQRPYKPGSVHPQVSRNAVCLVIYLVLKLPPGSSVLPSIVVGWHWASYPLTMVYANLQPPEDTAPMSPPAWWALTSPSHLDTSTAITINELGLRPRDAVILFCPILPSPVTPIFGSGALYAARTFLSPKSQVIMDQRQSRGTAV